MWMTLLYYTVHIRLFHTMFKICAGLFVTVHSYDQSQHYIVCIRRICWDSHSDSPFRLALALQTLRMFERPHSRMQVNMNGLSIKTHTLYHSSSQWSGCRDGSSMLWWCSLFDISLAWNSFPFSSIHPNNKKCRLWAAVKPRLCLISWKQRLAQVFLYDTEGEHGCGERRVEGSSTDILSLWLNIYACYISKSEREASVTNAQGGTWTS